MTKATNYTFPLAVLLIGLILFNGCVSTKFVPEDRYLLGKNDVEINSKAINREELISNIKQKENLRILGFLKFHLFLYNLSSKKKEKGFLKRIGEAPVIYDNDLRLKSEAQLKQYLKNKGYYNATVTSDLQYSKKRSTTVVYHINVNEPYYIRTLKYTILDSHIKGVVMDAMDETLVKAGDLLDVDMMTLERTRLASELNNLGYFNFTDDYIHFSIDSSLFKQMADVEMIIEPLASSDIPGIIMPHKKYWVESYQIYLDSYKKSGDQSNSKIYNDTLVDNGFNFYFNDEIPIRESLIMKSIEIKPGSLYDKMKEVRTYNNIYGLRQFKYVNIQYQEIPNKGDSLNGYLLGKIFLPMQIKQNYSFDIEGTTTSSNLGIAGNLNYQHKNLFKGGQIFDLTFRGARERQVIDKNNPSSIFNMRELGTEAKILFPVFLFPFQKERISLYSKPQTTFSIAYNFQERPGYTRTIANATFGYQWKTSSKYSHYLNPIDLNVINISRIDTVWFNSIQNLFIKSSYSDHVIASSGYTLIFNDQNSSKSPIYHYVRLNFETAGNTLWALSSLLNRQKYFHADPDPKFQTSYYRLFNTRFAQYIKGDVDFRYGYRLDKFNAIAFRSFLGIGVPYGNFNIIPPEKQYFTGGANGIRARQVRYLGPGSSEPSIYPNQSGDIKLEANLEYRYHLVWIIEGALFLDVGNIWAINNSDNRPGAVFQFNNFYKEIAVGTGAGLRFVTPYFIVRTDLGLKLCDPSQTIGQRWIPVTRRFNSSDLNFNIAIGYPF